MTQYLVTTFKDSTGLPHEHFTVARDNQTFTVVEVKRRKEKYEAQVKRGAVIKLGQLFENIREWEMIKEILRLLFLLAMYELGKYVTSKYIL